jgi:hypothetical protein
MKLSCGTGDKDARSPITIFGIDLAIWHLGVSLSNFRLSCSEYRDALTRRELALARVGRRGERGGPIPKENSLLPARCSGRRETRARWRRRNIFAASPIGWSAAAAAAAAAAVKAKVIALYALVLSNANHRRQNVRRAAAPRRIANGGAGRRF